MPAYRLHPACKDYLWGGHHHLREEFGVESQLDPLAEAWVLSCHPDGPSVTDGGETFPDYLKDAGETALGKNCGRFEQFPMLIKLIDARENLSIQVHPSDEYALAHEGQYGKTEMWVVLEAAPDAFLYYGFEHEVTKEEFSRRIADGTLTEILHKAPAKKGDVFFIPSGTLHAIGAGLVIAEIQQNSNVTYRVFDYGRVGADGKPRALHVDQALEVTELKPVGQLDFGWHLGQCPYFTTDRHDAAFSALCDEQSFQAVLITDGTGTLIRAGERHPLRAGDCYFIPAGSGPYQVVGGCQALVAYVA